MKPTSTEFKQRKLTNESLLRIPPKLKDFLLSMMPKWKNTSSGKRLSGTRRHSGWLRFVVKHKGGGRKVEGQMRNWRISCFPDILDSSKWEILKCWRLRKYGENRIQSLRGNRERQSERSEIPVGWGAQTETDRRERAKRTPRRTQKEK